MLLFAKDKRHLNRFKKKLDALILLDVTEAISALFRQFLETYSLSHRPSLPDMFNAAFAAYYSIEIFTLNISDFSFIKGLKVIKHNIKPLPRKKGFW